MKVINVKSSFCMFSHSKVMIFPVILLTFFSVSVGWDHLYRTGLDVGQKIDFKSTGGRIWNLLKPHNDFAGENQNV